MQGMDKGLQNLHGQPLAWWVLQQLQAQCGQVMLNANRNRLDYQAFDVPVWPDSVSGYPGPLAGFLVGLEHCSTPYVQTAACDVPCFPTDLVQRLGQALVRDKADMAIATSTETDAQGHRHEQRHPVFCLMRSSLHDSLSRFIRQGGRKVDDWCALHHCVNVHCGVATPENPLFFNVNSEAQLMALQNRWSGWGRHSQDKT
jgi:molybdopterin-guanine dinucleotide biosynthesis protein A